ncbi:hypothetical protein [Pararhodobacter zhoushanensis]|uniref:Uncharacterized protein n=1 Tax=Pararhodobacter zhoushanensis TaxID=2479545 RepID=A0ABT3GYN4_9RHOB|nr:hypothetical protein [Pararhodobacter zhoushanensis]MCW1932644.1 hypothetical protein [Pararhodobacter zhoushanensis]
MTTASTNPPLRHGAVALLCAAPTVARRWAMKDTSLPLATRQRAAHWLRLHGTPADQAAAQAFLTQGSPS